VVNDYKGVVQCPLLVLAQGCYMAVPYPEIKPAILDRATDAV